MRKLVYILVFFIAPLQLRGSLYEQVHECLADVQDHIQRKIEEAEVIEYPFPHIIIENIFPDDYYQRALKYWPAHTEFGKQGARHILPVTYGCLENTHVSADRKTFWHIFGEVVVNRYIKPALTDKLKTYFPLKFGMENFPLSEFNSYRDCVNYRQDCLVMDEASYTIVPHIDQLNLFAALLIYFPQDNDHQRLGTIFYECEACDPLGISKFPLSAMRSPKKIAYTANTLVCFLQTPVSWHAVEASPYKDKSYYRRLYIAPIFLSSEFMNLYYPDIYKRSTIEEYFFDHRFLTKKNWSEIWSATDYYQ